MKNSVTSSTRREQGEVRDTLTLEDEKAIQLVGTFPFVPETKKRGIDQPVKYGNTVPVHIILSSLSRENSHRTRINTPPADEDPK